MNNLRDPTLDKELQETNDYREREREKELAPPRFELLLGYPRQIVSTETVYKQKAKMDSAGSIYILVHVCNINKEKTIKLRAGRASEGLKGGEGKEEIMELYCN